MIDSPDDVDECFRWIWMVAAPEGFELVGVAAVSLLYDQGPDGHLIKDAVRHRCRVADPPGFLERFNSEIPSVKERDYEMEVATSPLDMGLSV